MTDVLESCGVRVYKLNLPYAEGYDNHPFARRIRAIGSGTEAFDCEKCIDTRRIVDVNDLRWVDGVYLDDRSSLRVAQSLEKHLVPEHGLPNGK